MIDAMLIVRWERERERESVCVCVYARITILSMPLIGLSHNTQ